MHSNTTKHSIKISQEEQQINYISDFLHVKPTAKSSKYQKYSFELTRAKMFETNPIASSRRILDKKKKGRAKKTNAKPPKRNLKDPS